MNIDLREWIQAIQPYGYRVLNVTILEDVFRAYVSLLDPGHSSRRLRWSGVALCPHRDGQGRRGRHWSFRCDAALGPRVQRCINREAGVEDEREISIACIIRPKKKASKTKHYYHTRTYNLTHLQNKYHFLHSTSDLLYSKAISGRRVLANGVASVWHKLYLKYCRPQPCKGLSDWVN